jgi:threonine/homoserine/homoserine lactone efflux protein
MRHALLGGRPAGIGAACGAAVANSTHALAAGLGLAVIVVRVPAVATGLRYAGSAYLAWLAWQSLRRAWRGPTIADRVAHASLRTPAPFMDGVLVNLLNPAIATFYLVVVPDFLRGDTRWSTYLLFAAIHVALAWTCHVMWTLLFDRVRTAAHSRGVVRALDGVAGIALAALAWRTVR